MVFKLKSELYSVELERKEGENLMYINYIGAPIIPSIADSSDVMAQTINALVENPNTSRIIFVQQKNYDYPFGQVQMLVEIAQLYNYLIKQEKILSVQKLSIIANVGVAYGELTHLIGILKRDPVGAYLDLKRKIRQHNTELVSGNLSGEETGRLKGYVLLLERLKGILENTKLIKSVLDIVDTYGIGDRTIYQNLFRPDILPNFTFTRLVAQLPEDAELVDQYFIQSDNETITVTILKKNEDSRFVYHIMPPEYTLSEEHHMLLNLGRSVLLKYEPKAEEFTDPAKVRGVFFNIARDLLNELAQSKNISLNYRELLRLAKILVRQTIGFGLVEVLLMDKNIQDIFLNAPIPQNPIFIKHAKYEECETNILPSYEDADSWAAKLRLQSGRPLDEANPILDTEITLGNLRARVAAIQRPLSPSGVAYAIRKPRDEPWTLPLYINNKMLNSFAAGLLSFLIEGARTILIAGTRSSGKTSLLGALMLEMTPKIRALIVEDTLELPVDYLKEIGYNVQRMKVRSALLETTTEIQASEGIRASLRLGDSALIVGEVRSDEAKALYEAMRVGALANVVAGTIHGSSPYSVFDRVVNDLGVPTTSFKATDLVLVANPIKTPDGLHSLKRVVQLTEVRKHWTQDPLEEKGFVDLLRYDVEKDELIPTDELINGDSEIIKAIAGNVKGWAGNWEAVYDNIILRGKIKQELVEVANKFKMPELIEGKFNVLSNDVFRKISDNVTKEIGLPTSERVFPLWKEWLMSKIKEKK